MLTNIRNCCIISYVHLDLGFIMKLKSFLFGTFVILACVFVLYPKAYANDSTPAKCSLDNTKSWECKLRYVKREASVGLDEYSYYTFKGEKGNNNIVMTKGTNISPEVRDSIDNIYFCTSHEPPRVDSYTATRINCGVYKLTKEKGEITFTMIEPPISFEPPQFTNGIYSIDLKKN